MKLCLNLCYSSMTDNFRQNYYSSLGVKGTKPALENALQGDVLQIEKLNKLCLWVRIPHMYRCLVWKTLLGVLPLDKSSWESVMKARREQYQ